MERDIRLALAVRDLVLAVERYRGHAARGHLRIGVTETVALGHLYVNGPLTASELAAELTITSASATELVDRIEQAGYARRVPHPTDRRKRLISLSDHGRDEFSRIYGELGEMLGEVYHPMSPADQRLIDQFITEASAAINNRVRADAKPQTSRRALNDQTPA
ncbi:MarR family winged helix-turn-helix transcriptional regulator [Rhodococcus sp. T2V]|uniref:MarR family winged helix-turn-helix transcriptional regulator n=1 Tax=Rhodococcus sp. T2V TaxID=3034164 RepID=UPI0023E32593|nr:MarR family transcriptional regulator [Rhodococcus sp. T2V]MDF3311766.1 MarR family transcriptional regulator [Rhodococcus sp. T2V]